MEETIDARDVLDANAKTSRPFRARILGHFRRIGPDTWDPYRFVQAKDGREIDVLPGLKIQVEEVGAIFRIRSEGKVWRAEWADSGADRARFIETCTTPHRHRRGWGVKAMIAKKLKR